MTVESAWDDEVARAGERLEDEYRRYVGHSEPEQRSVAFVGDWEPDPEELRVVRDYLAGMPAPARFDTPWHDHCEGLAGGILQALWAHRSGKGEA